MPRHPDAPRAILVERERRPSMRRMRPLLRTAFVAAMLVALAGVAFALDAILTPAAPPSEVALGRADDVTETPRLVRLAPLDQLPALARRRRNAVPVGTGGTGDPHGIYLVRDDGGAIRAYLAADPRSGCLLDWIPVVMATGPVGTTYEHRFHDTCHGSLYDRNGTVVGGPSPWTLDEAIISVRDATLYARTTEVRAGSVLTGDRSVLVAGCDLRANVRSVGGDGRMSILGVAAGRQDFLGQVYRGPFVLQVYPGVPIDGHAASDLAQTVSVGNTVCLTFKQQESAGGAPAFAGTAWVLTQVSVQGR